MPRTIAISTQKGGVAKTTTTANLAVAWGEAGRSVLVVDVDPQYGLTASLGLSPDRVPATIADALRSRLPVQEAITATEFAGVDLICGHRDMRQVELEITALAMGRERVLADTLEGLDHDLVLIDCAPTLGLLTINALMAADELVIPVSMQDRLAFEGAIEVIRLLPSLERIGARIQLGAVVMVKANPKRVMYGSVREALFKHASGVPIAQTEIPDRADFNNALGWGRPLLAWRPRSEGAQAYRALAAELADGPLTTSSGQAAA